MLGSNHPASRLLKGAILIGGKSRRMGQTKALLTINGETLLRRTLRIIRPYVEEIVLVGTLPEGLEAPAETSELRDAVRMRGPLGGILAPLRHDPSSDWLVAACDMPALSETAIAWLKSNHSSGNSATVGALDDEVQPFPGIYSADSAELVEQCILEGSPSMRSTLGKLKATIIQIPIELKSAWRNLNTLSDWEQFRSESK